MLQDDTVFPHLTVKETLTYSALLRLPNSLSNQQKTERAMDVLSQLGLEKYVLLFLFMVVVFVKLICVY